MWEIKKKTQILDLDRDKFQMFKKVIVMSIFRSW